MKNAHFTKQERFMILWLRFLAIAFIIVGFSFALQPSYLLQYIDSIGLIFFNFRSSLIQESAIGIWWILSLTLIVILITTSFQSQRDWLQYHSYVGIILLAKGLTTIGFAALASFQADHFFYIVGTMADGLLFLVTLYAYIKAIKSRTFISHTS